MSWIETESQSFVARHSELDAGAALGVLTQLERTRQELEGLLPEVPGDIAVVLHGSPAQLQFAQPALPITMRLTAPASRRYLVGWPGRNGVHVLAPRVLEHRASSVQGSREMLLLSPAALYAQLAVRASNTRLRRRGAVRFAWLLFGAAQFLSGQTEHARPAIARRLREGGAPAFPPDLRDAHLLGGTVLDLLAREEGREAVARLAISAGGGTAHEALEESFDGRPVRQTEATWRAHLARLAGREDAPPHR